MMRASKPAGTLEGEGTQQDKRKEITFFDAHAAADEYDVFTPQASTRVIDAFIRLSGVGQGARIADLGCGSGAFTHLLKRRGYHCLGVDISSKLLELGRRKYPDLALIAGDVEQLPLADASVDAILLSGVVHHLPDPRRCAAEVHRVLRGGGSFMAFDPNRLNPFMWLYRDRSSPFYSPVGVTENERPIRAREVAAVFRQARFTVSSHYLAGLAYRYVASSRARRLLPVYNWIDATVFGLAIMRPLRPFVLTVGKKASP